jgi:hypothetical protein
MMDTWTLVTSGTASIDSLVVAAPAAMLPSAASTSTRPRRRIENRTKPSNMNPSSSRSRSVATLDGAKDYKNITFL